MSDNAAPKPIPNGDIELTRVMRELENVLEEIDPDELEDECPTCSGLGEVYDDEYGKVIGCDDCMGRGFKS